MKAAIYARVSTKDKGQDVENQLTQLRRYAGEQKLESVEFIDHETGKHSDRSPLLLSGCRTGPFPAETLLDPPPAHGWLEPRR